MLRALTVSVLLCSLTACVNNPENYRPAGFESVAQAREYVPDYLYYAKKLTKSEWDDFYDRFPDYWKDIQAAKSFGSTMEYHPWYVAYAFRWSTLRRKEKWGGAVVSRLDRREVLPGDDAFKVIYALGVPGRIIWDNDFEILAYLPGTALIFEGGNVARIASCEGCAARYDTVYKTGMEDSDVITTLKLSRPKY